MKPPDPQLIINMLLQEIARLQLELATLRAMVTDTEVMPDEEADVGT